MRFAVIQGPNLNMLGVREPEVYGALRLEEIQQKLDKAVADLYPATDIKHFQSNHEGQIIDFIHGIHQRCDAIIINPGGLTHTSVSLRDALASVAMPFVEVHLSNVFSRESFRHHSYLSDQAMAVISGAGWRGYLYALDLLYRQCSVEA
ncbi:type II 3-dehydroquinate dehydratase [Desulfurispira natronophila]|uniref:3-dehydroquinate dehydratase n=1 Tax=Desulfurispira natronophila TaxID=682562 RepID=A0A7W8DFZ9_9BACT|nr:type II 3-dehydroquinate dehydratase [Desulfurispira natronophila]MBB5020865.1 3-dehydroquinate dehydratase-2 [Desulfurispira natronophila]